MGFSFSSQVLTSDASGTDSPSSSNSQLNKKPTGKNRFNNRQTNSQLQMDDFLALAREPSVDVNKKSQIAAKNKEDERKKKAEEERLRQESEQKKKEEEEEANQDEQEEANCSGEESESTLAENEEKETEKKKRDRNAPCKPRPPKSNPKKLRAKIKYEEKLAAEKKKKEEEELAEATRKLELEAEAKKKAEAAAAAAAVPVAKKDPRLNEIVQEYLLLAPINDKYRARNSELMNIVHDLVGLDRSVNDFKPGCGKEDKKFLKYEELLTRCLLKFDNIERNNEVLTKTRKELINLTQRLINKLETKALDMSTPVPAPEVKEIKTKPQETAAVEIEDIKVEENNNEIAANNGESVEDILKKKGKSKKPKNFALRKKL